MEIFGAETTCLARGRPKLVHSAEQESLPICPNHKVTLNSTSLTSSLFEHRPVVEVSPRPNIRIGPSVKYIDKFTDPSEIYYDYGVVNSNSMTDLEMYTTSLAGADSTRDTSARQESDKQPDQVRPGCKGNLVYNSRSA
jgi:hypothetical protein